MALAPFAGAKGDLGTRSVSPLRRRPAEQRGDSGGWSLVAACFQGTTDWKSVVQVALSPGFQL